MLENLTGLGLWEKLTSVAIFGYLMYVMITQGFKFLFSFVDKLGKLCDILAELKELVAGFKEVIVKCQQRTLSNSFSSTPSSEKPL